PGVADPVAGYPLHALSRRATDRRYGHPDHAVRDAHHVADQRVGSGAHHRLCQPALPHDGSGAGTDAWRCSVRALLARCHRLRDRRMDHRNPAPASRHAPACFLALTRGHLNVAAIALKNVTIQIPIYDVGASSLRKAILSKTVGGRFEQAGSHVIVDALKDISFEAHNGDRIALIGNNGSGKSTLLRVLSDVYPATVGTVQVVGEVSPMFDAMLGMSMDATGMENIWICGRLWGLSPAHIKNSIDDIADFTELGDFLDVPVRTYSTG